jgi:hypothetical protein
MRKKKRVPIDELLEYWIDISKRPTLTLEDYALFLERAEASFRYFCGVVWLVSPKAR